MARPLSVIGSTTPARRRKWSDRQSRLYGFAGRGVDCRHVAALVTVAEETGVCQILKARSSAVFSAHDVVDLVSKTSIVFVDQAVFATIMSPLRYCGSKLPTDITRHVRGFAGPLLSPS